MLKKTKAAPMTAEVLERLARWLKEDLERLAKPREEQKVRGKPPNAVHAALARMQRLRDEAEGAVAVIVMLAMSGLIGMLVLVVAVALTHQATVRAETASESVALSFAIDCAAGRGLDEPLARVLAEANFAQVQTVEPGGCDPATHSVRAEVTGSIANPFAGFGPRSFAIDAWAVAEWDADGDVHLVEVSSS